MHEHSAGRQRRGRSKCGDESICGRGNFTEIFVFNAESLNAFADVAFLAESYPELLAVGGQGFSANEIVNNAAIADAAELNGLVLNQLFDFAFGREWQIDDL